MTYKKKSNDSKETVISTEFSKKTMKPEASNSSRSDFPEFSSKINLTEQNEPNLLSPPKKEESKKRPQGRPRKGEEKNPPNDTVIELTHSQLLEMIPKGQLKALIPKKPRSEKQIAATEKLIEKTRERARVKKEAALKESEELKGLIDGKIKVSIPNTVKKASEPTHNKIKRLVKEAKDSLDSEVETIKQSVKKNTEEVKSSIEKVIKPILARSASKESLNKEPLESIPETQKPNTPNTPNNTIINPLRAMMNRKYGFS